MERDKELVALFANLTDTQADMLYKIATVLVEGTTEAPATKYMTTEEAAGALGVTSATIRSYIKNGKLKGRRLSARRFVVTADSVQANRLAQNSF